MPGDIFLDRSPGMSGDASAERFNAINRVARTVSQSLGNVGGRVGGAATNYAVVNIKNTSGEPVPFGGVLGIGSDFNILPANNLSAFKEGPSLVGVKPTEADHTGKFAIALSPIGDGKIGQAVVAGAAICKIEMEDEAHGFADVLDEDVTKLKSGESGLARIVQVESGTGEKWALIAFGSGAGEEESCPKHWFKLRPITVPTSGTPTFSLNIFIAGTPYGATGIAYNASSATIKSAIESAATILTTNPDYGLAVSTGTLPGDVISLKFTIPDGVSFNLTRGTQSTTTNFYYQVDPMAVPE